MKLNVEERIRIFEFIPFKGSYNIIKDAIQARKSLIFNEEEVRKYDISSEKAKDPNNVVVRWSKEVGNLYYKDIEFPLSILEVIVNRLKDKCEKGELTEDMMSLYEKFVVNENV